MINKDYQESIQTAAGGGGGRPSRQSGARVNKRSISYKHKKCEPDKRQLEFDFGISKQKNTGGGI